MGLDSLYCGKWRKISKSRRDLDLDWTMPMSNSSDYFHILQYFQVLSQLNLYFLSYCVHRETDRQTDRHTDGDEYSIVAVDKPQL